MTLTTVSTTVLYCDGRPIESRIWSIERRRFQWPWTTLTPGFKVTLFFDAEYLRNGTRYRHSFNGILIGIYIHPTQQCRFEWRGMILGNLAKYSMTRSNARPLCDSRATCVGRCSATINISSISELHPCNPSPITDWLHDSAFLTDKFFN